MERCRSNGNKFQEEITRYCKKQDVCAYVIRLRTPEARYANVTNIADFILFAKNVIILEAKETSADSFSLGTMQQREEVEKFVTFYDRAKVAYGGVLPYKAVVLVHFIKLGKYSAYFIDSNEFKVIRPADVSCLTTDSLAEVMQKLIC